MLRRAFRRNPVALREPVVALCSVMRGYFVRFQPTPNEDCYKFYVDGVEFLPEGIQTLMFDRVNDYQSPVAQQILRALPMVEEVTVGRNFITVKRVEQASSEAAARYFAMRFHGTIMGAPGGMTDEEQAAAAAARSQALQQRVTDAMNEGEQEVLEGQQRARSEELAQPQEAASASVPLPPDQQPFFQPGGPDTFEMGGFAVKQSTEADEALDEAAIQQLIEAMSWSELKMHVSALLTDHMFSGEPHVSPDAPHPHADTLPQEGDSEVVLMIKELIATNIRPQLQDDGGDIRFVRFDPATGLMAVELLGACRTCKKGKTTLADLIERTTRHWIPEVSAVVEVGHRASAFEKYAASQVSTAAAHLDTAAYAGGRTEGEGVEEEEEEEEGDDDPTQVAGEGGVHKRVVVDESTSAKVVRGVHSPPATETPS